MSLRTNSFLPLLAAALLLLVSPSSSGAERVNRFKSFTRLVLLPHSGAKCLDGSPPAYYFRPGTGAGRRKWHVHLPTGGWCFSPGECIARANSSLGSSRFWARRLPAAVENGERVINPAEAYPELGGLLSQDSITNPAFHSWNLVWLVYCDGGAYSSMRGGRTWEMAPLCTCRGGRFWKILYMVHLRTNRGMGAASHVLFSGSSAGAHAVLLNCDRLAASFPRASTKCLADSGFFVDAKDRFGQFSWRENVRIVTALHRINVPKCPSGALVRDNWVCFFPEHTLPQVSTPLFLFHSLFDWRFLLYEQQLPDSDLDHSSKCLNDQILATDASVVARKRMWDKVRWRQNLCSRREVDAVFSVASALFSRLADAARSKRNLGVFLAPRSVHTTLFNVAWFLRVTQGVKLSSAFSRWYSNSSRVNGFFVHD
ncbi:hypothetical protein CLOM_g13128 [Closterium sp. NIES-68]|nr:hypothetical protein CLOM_g13128 [Closterium sp. NIES-68]